MLDEFRSTMKWMLREDWCCGSASIPSGTVLEGPCHVVTGELDGPIVWQGHVVRPPLPLSAIALDTDAATQMQDWYHHSLWHQLFCAPGVAPDLKARREAIANWRSTRERIALDIAIEKGGSTD
jgi:hypothetical protein